jgi:hypothetical protein
MGFLSVEQLLALHGVENEILDPFSTLVGTAARIGTSNVLYPGVVVECSPGSELMLGSGNRLYPGTLLLASNGGQVTIGDHNQFGDGGCRVKANRSDVVIVIGGGGRFLGGAEIVGSSYLGNGAQVIGPITAQDCTLEDGGSFGDADPDRRGGVLKGAGLARGIRLGPGDVVNATGSFTGAPIERQAAYHPRRP